MIIKAAGLEIEAKSIIEDTVDGRQAIRVILPAGISAVKQDALRSGELDIDDGYVRYEGFTQLVEHAVTLARPVDIKALEDELAALKAQLKEATDGGRI